MTKKEAFINEVLALTGDNPENVFSKDALDYWNGLNASGDSGKAKFTPNGIFVLRYIQENKDKYNNLFKAKEIGEGLGISSRTASGAMRKLVTDGYIEKIGTDPVVYAITEKGITADLNAEEG